MAPPPDPQTIGPYRVVRRLGQGGMGVVYEVTQPALPRSLVLKQILGKVSERSLARFLREAEVMARVRHPGIVQIHQLGRTAAGPYLVAELVQGRPLSALCAEGRVAPERAARIARGVADAVAAVHAAGVLHRDLKPANVMLRPDDSPVLLDFGLARDERAERLTVTGEVLGTPAYLAPEQAAGRATAELDERCDVWGIGAILYELLVGEPPFTGDSAVELLYKVLHTSPEWPSALGAPVPPGLEAILKKALHRTPERRYPGAGQLRADLDRFLAGQPPLALAADRGRRARAAGVAAAAAVVALGGLGGAWAARARGGGEAAVVSAGGPGPADPGPAARRLDPWRLLPGERLVYALKLEEVLPEQQVSFGADLELVPGAEDPDGVPLACVVSSLRCAMGSAAGEGVSYATGRDPDGHPLAAVGRAAGRLFSARLAPATGEVSAMRGFAEIRAAVLGGPQAEVDAFMGKPGAFAAFVGTVLEDEFIRASMTSLTQVVGDRRRIPWRPDRASPGSYVARPGEEAARPAMASLSGVLRKDDRVVFTGVARFADGRLQAAQVKQELVAGASDRRCVLTWSMELVGPR